jgi:deazaflavin-dependent oxidoreductase (nitroreductase family)
MAWKSDLENSMPEKINDPQPPSGLGRLAFRAPIWLYRANLGFLLGGRFLLLKHTGRKSGLTRQTVLEVVKHDPDSKIYYVASGYGEKSDWYKNIMANPQVSIKVGNQEFQATAERLSTESAEEIMLEYGRKHPTALRELARIMGYRIENKDDEYRAIGRLLPIIAIHYDKKD